MMRSSPLPSSSSSSSPLSASAARRRPNVGIFMDLENCAIPSDVLPEAAIASLRMYACQLGRIAAFRAYFAHRLARESLRQALLLCGVNSVDVPFSRKNAADLMLLSDILGFVLDNPAPAVLVIVTADSGFAPALHKLVHRHYSVHVITNLHNCPSSLRYCTEHVVEWKAIASSNIYRHSPYHQNVVAGGTKTTEQTSSVLSTPSSATSSSSNGSSRFEPLEEAVRRFGMGTPMSLPVDKLLGLVKSTCPQVYVREPNMRRWLSDALNCGVLHCSKDNLISISASTAALSAADDSPLPPLPPPPPAASRSGSDAVAPDTGGGSTASSTAASSPNLPLHHQQQQQQQQQRPGSSSIASLCLMHLHFLRNLMPDVQKWPSHRKTWTVHFLDPFRRLLTKSSRSFSFKTDPSSFLCGFNRLGAIAKLSNNDPSTILWNAEKVRALMKSETGLTAQLTWKAIESVATQASKTTTGSPFSDEDPQMNVEDRDACLKFVEHLTTTRAVVTIKNMADLNNALFAFFRPSSGGMSKMIAALGKFGITSDSCAWNVDIAKAVCEKNQKRLQERADDGTDGDQALQMNDKEDVLPRHDVGGLPLPEDATSRIDATLSSSISPDCMAFIDHAIANNIAAHNLDELKSSLFEFCRPSSAAMRSMLCEFRNLDLISDAGEWMPEVAQRLLKMQLPVAAAAAEDEKDSAEAIPDQHILVHPDETSNKNLSNEEDVLNDSQPNDIANFSASADNANIVESQCQQVQKRFGLSSLWGF